MHRHPVVIDTNVVASGFITSNPDAPTARILDGMIEGQFVFLLSEKLVAEYREVLLRRRIRAQHGMTDAEVDTVLTEIVANGVVRNLSPTNEKAPDEGDQHLWDLLATEPGSVLVTGDRALQGNPPSYGRVLTPVQFIGGSAERGAENK